MKEQELIKKIEDQAKIFKSRETKGHGDDKRHDLIKRDEQKWMWTAQNKLDWSYAKIGSVFGRDPRSVEGAIERYKPKQVAKPEPYEETRHKQKMRELAGEFADKMWLPLEFASFIEERIPGDWYIGNGFRINISETGKIEPVLDLESTRHLHEGLLSHLRTGSFADVVVNITDWKRDSGEILSESHKLLKTIMEDAGERYNAVFSFDYLEQAGLTPNFFKTLFNGAIFGLKADASWYSLEGYNLKFGAFHIYTGSTKEDLVAHRDTHIELRGLYTETDLAKQIGKRVRKLLETQENIRNQLEKFSDTERLPGHCELC